MQVTPDELTALMVAVIDIERKRIVTANHITVTKTNAFIGDLQTDNARLRAALENVLNDNKLLSVRFNRPQRTGMRIIDTEIHSHK